MRARRGRVVAALVSLLVTLVTVLAGVGVLPTSEPAAASTRPTVPDAAPAAGRADPADEVASLAGSVRPRASDPDSDPDQAAETALPADSGTGRRVVFDIDAQRVWLVGRDGAVRRTYLVSGSLTDNLRPGSYEVWSTSRHAVGVDDSGTMEYFVRFAHGRRAAIGFHSIPVKDGRALQTTAQLGTPQSHGCIRQDRPDAQAMWTFAPLGTKVVVTA